MPRPNLTRKVLPHLKPSPGSIADQASKRSNTQADSRIQRRGEGSAGAGGVSGGKAPSRSSSGSRIGQGGL